MDPTQDRPHPLDRSNDPRAGVVGCLIFAGCMFLGLVGTGALTKYATRDVPDGEVFEALAKSGAGLGWLCGGLSVSLVVSAVVAIWCARQVTRKRPLPDDPPAD
jgi:hypothetical protein